MNKHIFPHGRTLTHLKGSKSQNGASLIEVLIAVLVLSLGMLGMASLQTRGMQFNTSSYYLSQANVLAKDILDRMRASNYNNPTIKKFIHGMEDAVPETYTSCYGNSASCSTTQFAEFELYSWLKDVAAILPSGKASIAEDSTGTIPVYIVTIQYNDAKADSSSDTVSATGENKAIPLKQYTYRTEL